MYTNVSPSLYFDLCSLFDLVLRIRTQHTKGGLCESKSTFFTFLKNYSPLVDRPVRSIGREQTENMEAARAEDLGSSASGQVGSLRSKPIPTKKETIRQRGLPSSLSRRTELSSPGASASLLSAGSSSWSQVGQCERGFVMA